MSVMWGMDHVWQGLTTPQTTSWPPSTPQIWSSVTLVVGSKSLNHLPRQCCSGPRMMLDVWIYYHTYLWVLYEPWTMSDRGGSRHRSHYDLHHHLRHSQMWPWFSEPWGWTMFLISGVVVQGWWCRYGCAISLFYESYMRHVPYLTGPAHPTDHCITPNYNPGMIIYYTGCGIQKLEPCTSISGVTIQGWC